MATGERESGEPIAYDLDISIEASTSGGGGSATTRRGAFPRMGHSLSARHSVSSRVTTILEPRY